MDEECEITQARDTENQCTQYKLSWDKGNKSEQFVKMYDLKKCVDALFKLGYGEVVITSLDETKY